MVNNLFKAWYYPDSDFLNAAIGNNPSYIWRSICEAKSLLKSGIRWKIRTWERININNQRWLDDEDDPYITSESPIFENNTVASLMCSNSRDWEDEIIRDLFNERDQQCILRAFVSNRRAEDKIYWGKESSCNYSVKSAYKLLQDHKGMWRSEDTGNLWCKLWKVKAPPKVLNLVWKALTYCLPTMTMLAQKQVPVLRTCPVCNGDDKTIMHALVSCPFTAQCWQRTIPDVHQVQSGEFYECRRKW